MTNKVFHNIYDDIDKVLYSEEELNEKCQELANLIDKDYQGKELVLVGILKGSFMFMSDLAKRTKIPLEIEFMAVSSYGNATKSSGVVRILKDLDTDIKDKHVLLVEDIIDSGNTLNYLMDYLKGRGAASVEVMCLLDKPAGRTLDISVKYVGYVVPDAFIIGYGIDYAERYRNLPYVATLKEEIYRSTN